MPSGPLRQDRVNTMQPESTSALSASVLVLNRAYLAVHVVNVRRAFGLLYRELAEVIDMDDGQFANYDFESWLTISQLRRLDWEAALAQRPTHHGHGHPLHRDTSAPHSGSTPLGTPAHNSAASNGGGTTRESDASAANNGWNNGSENNGTENNGNGSSDGYAIDWVRSVHFDLQVPRVIRLFRYDRVPKHSLRFTRRNLFARDGHQCQYCGASKPHGQLSLDHVIPRSRGGQTTWENTVCCCLPCRPRVKPREECNVVIT